MSVCDTACARVRLPGKKDEKLEVAHGCGGHSGLHLYSGCLPGKPQCPTSTKRGSDADYTPTFAPAADAFPLSSLCNPLHRTLRLNTDFQERGKKLTELVPISLLSLLILISASSRNCFPG